MVKTISTLLYICLFSTALACNKKRENLINQTVERENYKRDYLKFDSAIVDKDTIDGSFFGIKADFNGKKGTDNRAAIQMAIDYCSKNKKTLLLPKGKILLNSYGITPSAISHANIIELKSNSNIIGNNTELIVGPNFDDKHFVVLSGLNAVEIKDFTKLENINIKNITINFNSENVNMKTGYMLMRGIELGQLVNGEVSYCTFINGDITAAIITGNGSKDISKNISVHHNKFIDLIKSKENYDHTSVYLNSQYSSIYNNEFINHSTQGKLVACAGELHNSNTSFHDNVIDGYTRMNFVVSTQTENHFTKNLSIYNNRAKVTNAAVYLWTNENMVIDSIRIYDNNITCTHVNGYSTEYNGTQGIVADAKVEKNSYINNLIIENNSTTISRSIYGERAVNFAFAKTRVIKNFIQKNNKCTGCTDGNFYKAIKPSAK